MKNKISYFAVILAVSVAVVLLTQINLSVQSQSTVNDKSIEGVYEFVTQEADIIKPNKKKTSLSSPEWKGIWQIHNGYFSSVLMKDKRDKFFDCKDQDLGYESFVGSYTVDGNTIKFKHKYSLHPFYLGRTITAEYKIDKDTLTLIQSLYPTLEDTREGTIKTVLKRIKN